MEKQYTIKVSEDTWDTLMKVKQQKRFKSINQLLINYYAIKEDIEDGKKE